jgi:TonB family protein
MNRVFRHRPARPIHSTTILSVGAALFLVACATQQVADSVPLVPPQRLWSPALDYPATLMLEGIEGEVLLEAVVDSTGRVDPTSVRVLKASHSDFETPAIRMLEETRFRPATRGGRPTDALVTVPISFELASVVIDSVGAEIAMSRGRRLARTGRIPEALTAFAEAQRLDPRLAASTDYWYPLCWYGTIWDHASDVIPACDQLVKLAPDNAMAHDARGMARALTGDFVGAIDDFEVSIELSTDARTTRQRRAWIADLVEGRNPITQQVLETLRAPSSS